MAIDVTKIQAKFAEEQKRQQERSNRGDFVKVQYWKPPQGTSKLRIMPPWTAEGANADQFWREVYMHWQVGDEGSQRSFACAKKTPGSENADCVICDYVEKLRNSNDPDDNLTAKEYRARQHFYMNVVDYDDPVYTAKDVKEYQKENADKECPFQADQTKVQVWSFGVGIFRDVLSIFSSAVSSGLDLTDLESGRAIVVNRTGKGQMDTKYQIQADFANSPFEMNIGEHEYIEDALYNLDQLVQMPSEEKILDVLPAAASLSKVLPAKAEAKVPKALPSKAAKPAVVEEVEEVEEAPKKPAMKSRRATPAPTAKVDDVADLEKMLQEELG